MLYISNIYRRVAGLSASKARSLIQRREKVGPFTNRQQLKSVKGLGDKSFQQCVGFLRVNQLSLVAE
jgi:competence ComEA-like helix-hairpin-helix protein